MHERGTISSLEKPEIHTEKLGVKEGVPIIVMHGWGQNLESMRTLGELLGSRNPVWLMDLPGFGKSSLPSEDSDTVSYAEMLKRFMEANGIERAHLLGHSFGGRVSIRFTSRYASMVESVILVDSGGLKRKQDLNGKLRSMRIKVISRFCKTVDGIFRTSLYKDWFTPRFGSRDYLNAQGIMRKVLVRAVNEDVTEDASKIDRPTFILWGEKDNETPVEMGERLHSIIKDSRLLVLPGKDHFPFMGDGAHLCAHHILRFLDSYSSFNK